jgi:hypothetical protein
MGDNAHALMKNGITAEAILRHRIAAYLADRSPWVVEKRHPIRGIEKDWNQYGMPRARSSVTRLQSPKPVEPRMSEEELRANALRAQNLMKQLAERKRFGR